MHDRPIQQKQLNSSSSERSSPESEGKGLMPPAFQLMASDGSDAPPVLRKQSSGGLPSDLLNGFSASTGHDLSDVKVHQNSCKPAEVGALAYAQGNDIHLGAGQDKHLAHEAAHIVQQREGRVQANTEVNGMPVNNQASLEGEADSMGAKAAQMKSAETTTAKFSDGRDSGVAMQRMVAPIQMALNADDHTAIATHLHEAMTGWGTDEEGIFVVLQKLDKNAAEITALKTKYKSLYSTELVNDLRSEMSGSELALALEMLGIKDDPKAADIISATAPATPADFDAVVTRLDTAMVGAGTDEEAIYGALIPFKREAAKLTTLKTTYNTKIGRMLVDDLNSELSSSELSYALYLLNAPPPETTIGGVGPTGGADQSTAKVHGGDVTARTGDKRAGQPGDDMFAFGYEGGLANESRWLQFIWREIIVTKADGSVIRLGDSITTTGGTYNLTTDPAAPSYNTDSASPSSPFYEARGLNTRTSDSTTMYDMPGSPVAFVNRELADGATKVVATAHFNTFLIRDFRPMYRYDIDVSFTYTTPATPPRVNSLKNGVACTSLPDGIKARLISQYPEFAYIE